jgi:hypothetical protein
VNGQPLSSESSCHQNDSLSLPMSCTMESRTSPLLMILLNIYLCREVSPASQYWACCAISAILGNFLLNSVHLELTQLVSCWPSETCVCVCVCVHARTCVCSLLIPGKPHFPQHIWIYGSNLGQDPSCPWLSTEPVPLFCRCLLLIVYPELTLITPQTFLPKLLSLLFWLRATPVSL